MLQQNKFKLQIQNTNTNYLSSFPLPLSPLSPLFIFNNNNKPHFIFNIKFFVIKNKQLIKYIIII